jgi:hypothetical protein
LCAAITRAQSHGLSPECFALEGNLLNHAFLAIQKDFSAIAAKVAASDATANALAAAAEQAARDGLATSKPHPAGSIYTDVTYPSSRPASLTLRPESCVRCPHSPPRQRCHSPSARSPPPLPRRRRDGATRCFIATEKGAEEVLLWVLVKAVTHAAAPRALPPQAALRRQTNCHR